MRNSLKEENDNLRKELARLQKIQNQWPKLPRDEWERLQQKEKPESEHPCDNWDGDSCFCRGACSCHWVHQHTVDRMSEQITKFNKGLDDLQNMLENPLL
jgi:hypothetical protein